MHHKKDSLTSLTEDRFIYPLNLGEGPPNHSIKVVGHSINKAILSDDEGVIFTGILSPIRFIFFASAQEVEFTIFFPKGYLKKER